jgi:hypothetical protein
MMGTAVPTVGDPVVCADDIVLGTVEADEGTHLRLRRKAQPPVVWVAKSLVGSVEDGAVHLLLPRDDLHDGIIALPPARQREFGTLEALSLLVRRARAEGRI